MINTDPIIKFGQNVANYFVHNSSDNDFIMLCIDDYVYEECINGIKKNDLESELKKIVLNFNYQRNDYIPIAIASFQVKLYSDLKSYNEDTTKSNALKERFCKFYNLDSNQMWREEYTFQENLWKKVQKIFKTKYNRNLVYRNKSFEDYKSKNDYVGCPKSQLFFLNNNIQLLFYSINKRLSNQKTYTLSEIRYLFSGSRLSAGIQLEIYRKLQEFSSDYSYNLNQLKNLISFIIYIFANNRDPNIYTRNTIEFYKQEVEDNYEEDQLSITLNRAPNNDYTASIFYNSEKLPFDIYEIENNLNQMMEDNYFLYFEKQSYNWEYRNIYTKTSFERNFVLLTKQDYFFPNFTFKSFCGSFVVYTYENITDELVKKLNVEILGKVYKSSYLLGGIRIGQKKYLQDCTPWINPEKCGNPPDLSEPNFYCIAYNDGHIENILVCDNTPDSITNEVKNSLEIGWNISSASNIDFNLSSSTINGLLCSFSDEDRNRISNNKIISNEELFANKSIMNHFMKIQYHEFDKESSIYKLLRRGKYGL